MPSLSSIDTQFGFQNLQELQAAATDLNGFIVAQDFDKIIGRYIRSHSSIVLWPLIAKEKAEADNNQEMREDLNPEAGFLPKDFSSIPTTETDYSVYDLTDPGQRNKALGGRIKVDHYSQSLWKQQGQPWGAQLAKRSAKLMSQTLITLERALFTGDASVNPLEFNGLVKQMAPGHSFEGDVTSGDSVTRKLRGIVRMAISDDIILRNISHIFTSALGVELIENEAENILKFRNVNEITPGLEVPAIITQAGQIPIVTSPFLKDEDGGSYGRNYDVINYYIVDISTLCWKGVIPHDGTPNNFNPQVFDLVPEIKIESRLLLQYGTLKCKNMGQGIWRLGMKVPLGSISTI